MKNKLLSRMVWDSSLLIRKSTTSLKALTFLLVMVMNMNLWGAVTALSLPKEWAAGDGKNAYTGALGCTLSNLGSDYSSAPKLKFDNQGDYMIIQVADAPASISFNIKGNSVSGTYSFKVQESADGSSYTDALNITSVTSSSDKKTANLKSSTRYIKLIYTTKASGNMGVGGISITKAAATDPCTVTYDGNDHGTPAKASEKEASAGAGVTLPSCDPLSDDYVFDGWATTQTKANAGDADAGAAGEKYEPSADITLYAVYKYKVKWSVNGTVKEMVAYKAGANLSLPTVTPTTSDCDEVKVFVGWSADPITSATNTPPSDLFTAASGTVTAPKTYYAVFADKEGEEEGTKKITTVEDIVNGSTYYIGSTVSSTDYYLKANNESGAGKRGSTTTRGEGGKFIFTKSGDKWQIKVAGTDYYMVLNNTNASVTYQTTAGDYDITNVTGGNMDLANNSKYLALNSSSTSSFGSYNSKYNHIWLWKAASATYSNYTTTCGAAKELDHISVSGTPETFWVGDVFNHDGVTVTAHYTDESSSTVSGWTTDFDGKTFAAADVADGKTVTVSYQGKTATYTIDVKTIANTQATAYTTAKAIEIIDAGKDLATQVYVTGIVSKIVTEFSSQYGNISFNVSADGETTGDQFQFYRNFKGASKTKWTTSDLIPEVGDEVIGYGTLTAFGETYEFAEGNYIVSLTRPKKLTSITVSGTPDYFDTSMEFNHNGMTVKAHYNTGASDDAVVTESAEFTAPDMTTTGEKTVNVSYTENEITKETSYKINVGSHCNTPVTITKGTSEHGSFTLSAEGNQCADGLVVTVTPNAAEHYHFYQITATNGVVDNNAKTVSNITANTTINVEFEEDTKYELKWMVSGNQMGETQSLYEGDDVTAPTNEVAVPAACANEGKVFVGWTAQKDYEHATDAPEFFAPHKMGAANETYYAVFANVEGEAGDVTMSYSGSTTNMTGNNDANKVGLDADKWSVVGDKGAGNNNVGLNKDGTIRLYYNASGNTTITVSSLTSTSISKVEVNSTYDYVIKVGGKAVTAGTDGSYAINATSFVVDNGATSTIQINSIKIYYGSVEYSNITTSCVIPTYSVTIQSNDNTMGSVTVDPKITEDAYEAGTEFAVMAEPTDETVYRFIGWTITPDNTGATLDDATSPVVTFTTGTADVTLTANFEEIPADPITVTLEVGERGTLDCVDCANNTITEETAGEGVLVPNVNANEGWAFLGWSTSSTATEAQYKPADADIFYPSDDNKTLYAVYAQLYKVTLKYTDEVLTQETASGSVTLPSRDCKNETYNGHFAGWSITEFAEETTNPAETPTIYAESITPTADITLYPVFSVSTMGGTKWVKKTINEVEEGAYAIITTDGHAFNGTISDGHGQTTENAFVFDANNIATSIPTGICEISMRPYKNDKDEVMGYQMYNADKGYLYAKAASAKNLAWHSSEDTYWCVWSSNWEYYKNYSGSYAFLRSLSNSSFRTYSSNNGDVLQFAKKESVAENKYWSKPANDVVNPELDLAAGDYLAPQTIKITAATYQSDYKYYYTTNGNEPDKTSAEYDPETGIVLSATGSTTVNLIGYDKDGYTSQIAAAEYGVWATYTSLSNMYAGFQEGKPVGLTLTDAYIHKVYTPGGTTKQLFVQEKNSTLGVVLSGQSADFAETIIAAAEGKTITFTVTGEYALGNGRQQIGKAKIASCTISEVAATRPTAENYTTALEANNLLGLTQLTEVYAMSKESNIVTVNTKEDGTGETYKVYNIFNVVKTLPETNIKCVVKGLFNIRDNEQYIMPVLDTDFDVVEKQNAQLPEVKPISETQGEALDVAQDEIITIKPVAGFTTSYKINDAADWTTITTQSVTFNVTVEDTKLEVKATRPYYNDASAMYFYHIDASLTKYPITLPSQQINVKTETDLASANAGDKVTITISQNVARYWETSVTVVKTDEESVTTNVTPEGNHKYSFFMPAYPVTVKVTYADAPKSVIYYNKGGTGIEGEMSQESVYIGDEYTLKDCAFHGTGLTFVGWKAYKTNDESTVVTITNNKIIVPEYNVSVEAQWDMAPWKNEGTWELVTKTDELKVGDYVIFTETVNAGTDKNRQAGTSTVKKAGEQLAVTNNIAIADNKLTRLNNDGSMVFQVEEGNVENTYAFYADGIGYLNANGDVADKNYMITSESKESNNASWAIESIDATTGEAVVKAKSSKRNMMQMNTTSNIFAAYGSKQGGLAIYKFYPKAWTVTFDDNVEGEEIAVPDMKRADHTTNKVTISTMVPKRTGYTFSKWNSAKDGTGELTANPGNEITLTANKTLYAQWNIKQYNVAVAEVENVTIQAKPHSEEAIAEGANANVNFKKSVVLTYDVNEEYVFKSWKVTKADDETTVVPISVGSSTTFEVPAYDVKVSAVIESKATTQLTVTYHANGGKNKTEGGLEDVSEQVNWNTTIKFAEHPCPFEKNLCTFAGWNTKEDGTGTTYKTQVTVKTDIDLYAMWEASAVEYVLDTKEATKVKVQEGVAPAGSAATFVTTYTGTFGQLTKTNSGTLTLTGYAGKVITGVKMQMKSNASSGAGTIVIKVGDKEICSTSYEESFGSHSNSYSVAELQNFNSAIVGETENITIVVSCTDNSLYIKGYTIEYSEPEATVIRSGLTSGQYTTYCERQTVLAGTYTGATFWNIAEKTTMDDGRLNSITIEQYFGDLEAGVPYIMLPEATELKGVKYGDAVEEPANDSNNGLVGVFENTPFGSVTDDEAAIARGIYVISDGTLYLCGNNCGVYAYRAYIQKDQINYVAPSGAPRRTIGGRGVTTMMENIFGEDSKYNDTQKVLVNGQLYIIRGGKTFDATGKFVK